VKFNKKTKGQSKTVNYEGATSYKTDEKSELVSRVLCSLVGEKKFYISGEDSNKELINLLRDVADKDPEFCLKLAAYARNEFYLRSVPQLILVEIANYPKIKGTGLIGKYAPYIIKRADEITECMSYQLEHFGKPIPTRFKKAIANAFNQFSRYQLAKYNRDAKVKMRDAMFLCHPNPKDKEHEEIFKKLADKTLEPPDTWEVFISTHGSTKETWEYVIDRIWLKDGKIYNYFAILRNLRNLLDKNISEECVSKIAQAISNKDAVKKNMLLPFRYLSAYKEIQSTENFNSQIILESIAKAMDISVINIPKLDGRTCIAVDNSGSMDNSISSHSVVEYRDIAATLGSSLNKISNSLVIVFSENAIPLVLNRNNDTLSNAQIITSSCEPSSTNAYKVPQLLLEKGINVDRVILLSDMQCWDSGLEGFWGKDKAYEFAPEFRKYKKNINPDCWLYSVDLAGYGKGIQVPQGEKNTVLLAGWSDRIFDFIGNWEKDRQTQVKMIENYL